MSGVREKETPVGAAARGSDDPQGCGVVKNSSLMKRKGCALRLGRAEGEPMGLRGTQVRVPAMTCEETRPRLPVR